MDRVAVKRIALAALLAASQAQAAVVQFQRTQRAGSTPFDNSTNGFVATDVQAALEEINSFVTSAISLTQIVYVRKSGIDATCTGTFAAPCLTIAKAFTLIADSSPTKRYRVDVGPGEYPENLALPANVYLGGAGPYATRITGATLTLNHATWNTALDNRSAIAELQLTNALAADFTAQASASAGRLYLFGLHTTASITATANAGSAGGNVVVVQNSTVTGTWTQSGVSATALGTLFSSIVVNSAAAAGAGAATFTAYGGGAAGNITATWTSNGAVTLNLRGLGVAQATVLAAAGASCAVLATADSLPVPANRTLSSGATLTRINDNFARGLLSATTNVDASAATAPTSGQVLTASSTTAAAWALPALTCLEVSATAGTTTTSSTDALLGSMTLTPTVAGKYLVLFNSDLQSNAAGAALTFSYYLAGAQLAETQRKIIPFDGGTLSATSARGLAALSKLVDFTGANVLEVRWSISSGTGTAAARTLIACRVGA